MSEILSLADAPMVEEPAVGPEGEPTTRAVSSAIVRAAGALHSGELVVMPTDTVYGLGAIAFNEEATRRIFVVKKRPRSLPLPVLVYDPRQAWALAEGVPDEAKELAAVFWPGPLTLILNQAPELAWDLGDATGTVAMRVPAHDDLLALLYRVGPMAMTSANISGEPTPPTAAAVAARLGDAVGLTLDGGPALSGVGSTIVDLSGPEMRLVREGPIGADALTAALGESD